MPGRTCVGGAWLVAIALGAAGCTPSKQVCGADQEAHIRGFVADLTAAIVATNISIDADVELPAVAARGSPARGSPAEGMLVVLDRHGLRIGGERVTGWRSGEHLVDAVDRQRAIAEATHQPAGLVLVVAIASDVSTHVVVELLELARRVGFARVGFVVEASDGVPIPPIPEPTLPDSIRERAGDDPQKRLEVMSQLLEAEAVRCPALGEPLPQGGIVGPGRALVVLEATRERLLACQCAADVDRVLSLAHVFAAPTRITMISEALSFEQALPLVTRKADAPWSEVASSVFAVVPRGEPPT